MFLAEAIAQIESSLSRDLERHKELQYSTRLGIETLGRSVRNQADEVTHVIERLTRLMAALVQRLEDDAVERRMLTDAISRLACPLSSTSEEPSRVLGGIVAATTAANAGEISIVEDEDAYDDDYEGEYEGDSLLDAQLDAVAQSPDSIRTLLAGLTVAANGRAADGHGADDPELAGRANLAVLAGECGDLPEALRLCHELLSDQERVLGADDPATLTTRANIAAFTGESGDTGEALRLCRELLPDRVRVLGADHPDTLTTRSDIAVFTAESGDTGEALRLCRELLPDRVRVLGADHADTLTTRSDIAVLTGECGDTDEALRLCRELLADQERVLGADHPDTLTTRSDIDQLEPAASDW